MKPQADRHRHLAKQPRMRIVHRVEQLIDKRHFVAGIDVAVRSQRANVIEIQNADRGGVCLDQESHGHPAANQQNRGDEADQKTRHLLQPENSQHLAARQRSRIARVHHQRRSMPVQPSPERRNQPTKRSQHEKPHHRQNRDDQRLGQIDHDLPGTCRSQRKILAVIVRAKMLPHVMINMRIVHKRRHQKRNAAKQIPDDAKRDESAVAKVSEFVNK